jgi:hypothetical protein
MQQGMTQPTEPPARSRLPRNTAEGRAYAYFLAALGGLVPVFLWQEPPLAFLLLWPSSVMLIYAFFGLDDAKGAHLTFEFADSFYYLGFTLSVGSLLAALHPFSSVRELPEGMQMLRYFGAGMMSTLVGVIGRTVMQLFFRSSGETVESTNARIDEAASQYLENLGALNQRALNLLANGQSTVEQQLEALNRHWQGYGPVAETTVNALTTLLTTSGNAAVSFGAQLSAIGDKLQSADVALQNWAVHANTNWTAINQAQLSVKELLLTLDDSCSRVKSAVDVLAGMVGGMTDVQHSLVEFKDSITRAQLPPSPLTDQLTGLSQAISTVTTRLDQAARSLETAVSGYQSQLAAVLRHTASPEAIKQLQAFSEIGDEITQLKDVFAPLKDVLASTITEVKQFNIVLDEIADAATSKLERIG